MWTVQTDGAATMIAPNCEGRYLLARAPGSLDLLDCEPVFAGGAGEWASEPAQTPPRISPVAYIDTSKRAPADSPPETHAPHVTYTVALVSDNRRGGVSRSDGKPALQGGVDVRLPGWNFGVRSSTIAEHGNIEFSFYGAKTIEVGETNFSIGATTVTFPRAPHSNFSSLQASVSRAIGPVDATLAVNYAWKQPHLHDEDNLYVVARARTPVGRFMGVPVTLSASIGRMRGRFASAHSRSDWSLSATGHVRGVDVGLSYVDSDLGDARGEPAAVFSITHSF